MKKVALLLCLSSLLAGCSINDSALRTAYANHYRQTPEYIDTERKKTEKMDANALAEYAVAELRKRMNGQPRRKIDNLVTTESLEARGNAVVFNYSLSSAWVNLSAAKQHEWQMAMQKDLIYRTCSLETVKLAQQKGLEEEHNYFTDYPSTRAFTLRTSRRICIDNGFQPAL